MKIPVTIKKATIKKNIKEINLLSVILITKIPMPALIRAKRNAMTPYFSIRWYFSFISFLFFMIYHHNLGVAIVVVVAIPPDICTPRPAPRRPPPAEKSLKPLQSPLDQQSICRLGIRMGQTQTIHIMVIHFPLRLPLKAFQIYDTNT